MQSAAALVYTVGLDPLVARAMYSDLPGAVIHRRRPLHDSGSHSRLGRPPDLLLIGLCTADLQAELAAARAAWGERVLIVGVGSRTPIARVWRGRTTVELAEIGPGFLPSLLSQAQPAAQRS